jgi:hypothetical protein
MANPPSCFSHMDVAFSEPLLDAASSVPPPCLPGPKPHAMSVIRNQELCGNADGAFWILYTALPMGADVDKMAQLAVSS